MLNRIFIEMDTNNSGNIDHKKLSTYLQKFYDPETAKKHASVILQTIDVDNSNAIDF